MYRSINVFMFGLVVFILSPPANAQQWVYESVTDDFDDTDRSTVTPAPESFVEVDGYLGLGFKCFSDGINLLLLHGYQGGDSDDEVLVRYRVDKNVAYGPIYWSLAPNHDATFAPMEVVPKVISEMKAGSVISLRLTDPFDNQSLDSKIGLTGFTKAINKLERSCVSGNR